MSLKESPLSEKIESVEILGVRIHNVGMAGAIELLTNMAQSQKPHHVVTVNPEFVMLAQEDNEFKNVLNRAALAVPDGIGILWAARILGRKMFGRVAGVDLVRRMAGVARDRGLSIFLLGAAPGVAEETSRILQEENPGLRIAGTYAGSPSLSEEDTICSIILSCRPDILFVAYGPPRQDLWIARTSRRLQIPLAMGVGGTFDFITGVSIRAPQWIQNIGLEWAYRFAREPYRWRRNMKLPRFAVRVLGERWKTMRG